MKCNLLKVLNYSLGDSFRRLCLLRQHKLLRMCISSMTNKFSPIITGSSAYLNNASRIIIRLTMLTKRKNETIPKMWKKGQPLKQLIADSRLAEQNNERKSKIGTQRRSTVVHSAGGCNVVFEKIKVCDKTIQAIHFRKPDFSFSAFSSRVISFRSIVEL